MINIPSNQLTYQTASVLSSDLDSTSLCETESEVTLDRDMTGILFKKNLFVCFNLTKFSFILHNLFCIM